MKFFLSCKDINGKNKFRRDEHCFKESKRKYFIFCEGHTIFQIRFID